MWRNVCIFGSSLYKGMITGNKDDQFRILIVVKVEMMITVIVIKILAIRTVTTTIIGVVRLVSGNDMILLPIMLSIIIQPWLSVLEVVQAL